MISMDCRDHVMDGLAALTSDIVESVPHDGFQPDACAAVPEPERAWRLRACFSRCFADCSFHAQLTPPAPPQLRDNRALSLVVLTRSRLLSAIAQPHDDEDQQSKYGANEAQGNVDYG